MSIPDFFFWGGGGGWGVGGGLATFERVATFGTYSQRRLDVTFGIFTVYVLHDSSTTPHHFIALTWTSKYY